VGDDLFIALAFVTFILGGVFKLMGFSNLLWGITPANLIFLSMMCLLFSIALSLYDVAHGERK